MVHFNKSIIYGKSFMDIPLVVYAVDITKVFEPFVALYNDS